MGFNPYPAYVVKYVESRVSNYHHISIALVIFIKVALQEY